MQAVHTPTSLSTKRLGIFLAFGYVLWSGTVNALAKGLTPYLSPVTLLLVSEAMTAIFIILTFGALPLFKLFRTLSFSTICIAAFVGLLNSAIAPYLWFIGLAKTSAINASMISSVDNLFILMCSVLFLHERVTRMQVIGGATVLIGVLFIHSASAHSFQFINTGNLYIILSTIFVSIGVVCYKKYLSHVMPELAIVIRNISAFVLVGIASIAMDVPLIEEVSSFPLELVLLLLAFTFFSRYLNLTFYYEALDRLPVTTLSLITIATPLSSMIFAVLLLDEHVYSYQIVGAVFIILGLLVENGSFKHGRLFSFFGRFTSLLQHFSFKTKRNTSFIHGIPKHV